MKVEGLEPVERAFMTWRAQQCGSLETALAEWLRLRMQVERGQPFPRRHPQARVARRRLVKQQALRRARAEEAHLAAERAGRRAPPAEWSLGALMAAFLLPAEAWSTPASAAGAPRAAAWTPEPAYARFVRWLTAMRSDAGASTP